MALLPFLSVRVKFIRRSTDYQSEKMKSSTTAFAIIFFISGSLFAENQYYDVQKNDTLWSISREFSVSIDELRVANQISDDRTLRVGMRLLIPSGYAVEKGDTLWGIAQKHQTSVRVLRELNSLQDDDIKIGDILLVPSVEDPAPFASEPVAAERVATETAGETETPRSVDVAPTTATGSPYWPHGGVRNMRSGKLSGTEFVGSQGDDIVTIVSGEVVWSAPNRGYGNVIIIESVDNYLYLYTGLAATLVSLGERVAAGTKIAELGVDPHTGEAKLLFSVYKNGKLVDPSVAPRG